MGNRLLRVVGFAIVATLGTGCVANASRLPTGPTETLIPWASPTSTRRPATAPPKVSATVAAGASATPFKHVVRANETLLEIAGLYGVSLDALRALNPGVNPNLLSIGQELIIPDAEGTPIVALIPSSTPIPLALQPPRCYASAGSGAWCMTALRNASQETLEDIQVEFRIQDSSGQLIQSPMVASPVNFLPPGETMPLAVQIATDPGPGSTITAAVLHAITANELEGRYWRPTIDRSSPTTGPSSSSWRVSGTLAVPNDAPVSNETRLMAVAFDGSDQAVGYTVWEPESPAAPGDSLAFAIRVFSLGPPITRVDLLAETYAVQPAP